MIIRINKRQFKKIVKGELKKEDERIKKIAIVNNFVKSGYFEVAASGRIRGTKFTKRYDYDAILNVFNNYYKNAGIKINEIEDFQFNNESKNIEFIIYAEKSEKVAKKVRC